MMFIYDIYLNWCDTYFVYEFYEWNDNDIIEYIKKIPIFQISRRNFHLLKLGESYIEKDFLLQIKNKTILHSEKPNERIEYACVFTDGLETMAFEFDSEGKVVFRSHLQIEEMNYINEMKLEVTNLLVDYFDLKQRDTLLTRSEYQNQQKLLLHVEHLFEEKPIVLQYIWSELFIEEYSYNQLIQFIKNGWTIEHQRFIEFTELYIYHKKEL